MIFVNLFLTLAAIFTFIGMLGEKKDCEIKKGCTYGFLISLVGIVIINLVVNL